MNKVRCTNMNHGRSNAPVRFCPTCGGPINAQAVSRCDHQRHAILRRERYSFCHDCGIKLNK